jgi:hypothetical protein
MSCDADGPPGDGASASLHKLFVVRRFGFVVVVVFVC